MKDANSISMKLLALSKKYNVNHQMMLIRFFHERLLYRISKSIFLDHLLLKGGNLLYAVQGKTARPTVDIDLSGTGISNDIEEIERVIREIIVIQSKDSVVFIPETLTSSIINEHNQYAGVRIKVVAQLGSIKQNIQIDIGFGDVITPAPVIMHYPVLLEELEPPIIKGYTIETIVAEKLHAVLVLAQLSSRMKDFYDIYSILNTRKIHKVTQKEAIIQTFANRNTALNFRSVIFSEAFKNDKNRNMMWNAFLNKINSEFIPFKIVMNSLEQFIQEIFDDYSTKP